jgi:hypothetical protein
MVDATWGIRVNTVSVAATLHAGGFWDQSGGTAVWVLSILGVVAVIGALRLPSALHLHAAFREVDEVTFALPFTFDHEDYVQILTDIATGLGPALGWQPGA